jgi:hypothetical protein
MGHTRFKRKKKRWATQKAKAWRGGATITKTKQVQQSFDTIHDFYKLLRGLFGTGLTPNIAGMQQEIATLRAANPQDPRITDAEAKLQHAQDSIPLYKVMRAIMQYMIITLNSIVLPVTISPDIHTLRSIHADTQFEKYAGYRKEGQLFFAGQGNPLSKVTTSGIEIQGREYFEIPPGREWPKLQNASASFINLTGMLFNLNDNPDQDTVTAYYAALNQPVPANWQTDRREFTAAHRIYMLCDAGANTYGKLGESVRADYPGGKPGQKSWDGTPGSLHGPRLIEFVTPLTTADSASSNPYQDHEFIFVPSTPAVDQNAFISDANLYTSDIYEIRYERDQWDSTTGLGFKLVVRLRNPPNTVLFELVYGILGEGQTPFVRPAGSRAQPALYNSQGPSAASLSGCALLRALHSVPATPGIAVPAGVFQDIPEEKIGNPQYPLSPHRVRDMVETDALREQVVTELRQIMTQQNGVSPLCGTANMVDPYSLLGDRFGTFPPELWHDIKRGGDRDQVKAAHYLSQLRDANGALLYPFIHFVTGDELAAKMAVELGLAVIYQAGGNIRYWPKMFRFRPESRTIASPYGIATQPVPQATDGPWAITSWGGKRMKGGLRNPISANIAMPPYRYIEDKDGVQYTFDANHNFLSSNGSVNIQSINGRPTIIAHDVWLHPSNYVVMKNHVQVMNPSITPDSLLAEIRTQYQQIHTQISQIPELPARQLTAEEWNAVANGLNNIDYRPLPPAIKQAIINALQGIQLLQTDNRGIYQYDFINTVQYNNDPRLNLLDELTFRIVNDSKEDDGLEGAATIGANSPQVTVTPDAGGTSWMIPALLDENLLDYDIAFMAKRFIQTLMSYCRRQNLTIQEVRQQFSTQYGIAPIVSYIQAKYAGNAPNDLQHRVATALMTFAQENVPYAASSSLSSAPLPPIPRLQSTYSFAMPLPPISRVGSIESSSTPSTPSLFTSSTPIIQPQPTEQVSAITPSVTGFLFDSSPAEPATDVRPLRRAKVGITQQSIINTRRRSQQKQQEEREEKREARFAERRSGSLRSGPSNSSTQGQGGGKRHTKKKHHKRKKRETQRKRRMFH